MNQDILKGNWKQLKGKVREAWGRLTEDETDKIAGNYDQLVGKIQEKYGYKADEAKSRVNSFLDNANSEMDESIKVDKRNKHVMTLK